MKASDFDKRFSDSRRVPWTAKIDLRDIATIGRFLEDKHGYTPKNKSDLIHRALEMLADKLDDAKLVNRPNTVVEGAKIIEQWFDLGTNDIEKKHISKALRNESIEFESGDFSGHGDFKTMKMIREAEKFRARQLDPSHSELIQWLKKKCNEEDIDFDEYTSQYPRRAVDMSLDEIKNKNEQRYKVTPGSPSDPPDLRADLVDKDKLKHEQDNDQPNDQPE